MSYLTLEAMPGPSPEAKAAQLHQLELREAYYDALNASASVDCPAVIDARTAYNKSIEALEALLGPTAHCNYVDCDLWDAFSDAYKEQTGFRPRGLFFTRQQTLDWCLKNGFTEVS